MPIRCRQRANSTADERAFCQALLNNECPVWVSVHLPPKSPHPYISKDDVDVFDRHKRGFRLPPDDFVYGLKHPQQNGITGVAAGRYPMGLLEKIQVIFLPALQDHTTPIDMSESITIPDFIAINNTALRLGLTKVRDIHQYR